jgi:transcriptional regulator with XRE-family HTH domain
MNDSYDIAQIFADNLRSLRKRKNISQMELSARTGLSQTFINNIENCRKWVSPETMSLLCKELEAYPAELFATSDLPDSATAYRAFKEGERLKQELQEILSRYGDIGT